MKVDWKRVALAVVLALLVSCPARAEVLELRSLRVDAIRFFDGGHDPLVTQNGQKGRALGEQLDLHVDVDVLRYFYWNSTVHSVTDRRIRDSDAAGQFRTVNLQMQFGVRLFPLLSVYYWHSSTHLLDSVYTGGHWPVQDGIGACLTIYSAPTGAKPLIGGN